MMKKFLTASLIGLVGIAVVAMNPPQFPQTPPRTSPIEQAESPSDVPSPGQARMRARGARRNLSTAFGLQINPAIYRVLPRSTVTPPNLNIDVNLMVNDWFFDHITDEQKILLNKIAVGIAQRQRIMLSGEEYRLFNLFPRRIVEELQPFIDFSNEELEATEVVPPSESEHSVKRSRKYETSR